MNTRQGILASFRDWRLWALVVLIVFMADGSWAQAAGGGGQNGKFPFLSVDPGQARSIWGSFIVQWELFKSYTNNAVPALYYISLAATLVGAISIVFVKSLQDVKTISAWFLLVIICLFAPVNSKILFYPIDDPGASQNRVGDSAKVYGFTPQLVAIHVGTTLQVIFKDIFDSKAMKGLLDGALGKVALGELKEVDPGGPWVTKYNNYIAECGSSAGILPEKLLKSASSKSSASTSGTSDGKGESIPFSSALAEVRSYFEQTQGRGAVVDLSQSPIPTIIIPQEAPKGQENAYYAGVSKLYEQLIGQRLNIASDPANTVRQALDEIKNRQAKGNFGTSSILFYIAVEGGTSDLQRIRSKAIGECDRDVFLSCHNNEVYKFFEGLKAEGKKDGDNPDEIGHFLKSAEALQGFPTYIQDRLVSDKKQSSSGDNVRKSKCGPERGVALYEDLLNIPGYKDLDKLKTAIDNGTNLQDVDKKVWKIDDITSESAYSQPWDGVIGSDRQKRADRVQRILNVINSAAFWKDARTVEDRQKVLANLLIQSSLASSAKFSKDIQPTQDTSFTPSVTGGFLANTLGRIAVLGGEVVIWIASKFAGATAVAILYFVQVILDMLISLIILLTPVAFLFGIVIPSHAPGLLIQSIVILAIVKLVPVSFLIIDRMAGFLYSSIGILGGPDQSLKENLFLFAMAGIYGGIVGMTMFLLFKIGDAQNIQKLTELDKAAEQAADAGMKVATALATTASLIAGGAVLGGVGSLLSGKTSQEAQQAAIAGASREANRGVVGRVRGMLGIGQNTPEMTPEQRQRLEEQQMTDSFGPDIQAFEAENERRRQQDDLARLGTPANEEVARRIAEEEAALGPYLDPKDRAIRVNELNREVLGRTDDAAEMANIDTAQVQAYNAAWNSLGGTPPAGNPPAGGNPPSPGTPSISPGPAGTPTVSGPAGMVQGQNVIVQGAGNVVGGQGGGLPGISPTHASQSTGGTQTDNAQVSNVPNPPLVPPVDQPQKTLQEQAIDDARKIEVELGPVGVERLASRVGENVASALKSARDLDKKASVDMPSRDPGFWKSVISGAMGGAMAGGGLGKIPVVGEIITGALNEFYEAPERARVWENVGFGKWWGARGNAQRKKFLEQEASTLGAGYQYQQIGALGAYDGIYKAAQNAAAQAAAKVRDERDASRLIERDYKKGGTLEAEDFRAATLTNALQSLEGALQNAAITAQGQIKVQGGKIDLSPSVLKELVASKATKDVSGSLDGLFQNHYYLNEKDTRPAYASLARTRGDKRAMARFVTEDVDFDYEAGAVLKMVEDKANFMQRRGAMKVYQGYRGIQDELMAQNRRNLSASDLKVYRDGLPIQRIMVYSGEQGKQSAIMRSHQSIYLDNFKMEFQDQLKRLDMRPKMAMRFDSVKPQLSASIERFFQNVMQGVPQNVVDAMKRELDEVYSVAERAALSNRRVDSQKAGVLTDLMERAMQKLGKVDDVLVSNFENVLKNRGDLFQ